MQRFILRDRLKYHHLYIFFLYLITAYSIIRLPIMAGDTDLWYHLNSGRYAVNNLSLPQDSFFSFISPLREWIDYYWLFQVLVYSIYSFFDYYGLIFLRAIVYLSSLTVIVCFFSKKYDSSKTPVYFAVIITLYALLLSGRFQLIRPHIFTYFFIPLFIYLLEFKSPRVIYLPLLAVLWTNLHGIVYPVMLLVVLSYILEFFYIHIKDRAHIRRDELFYIIPLVLSMIAVFVTPHGSRLIGIPFISIEDASQYINEFRRLTLSDLLSFQAPMLSLSQQTIFNILLVLGCLSVIMSIVKKNIRLSHLLMFIGGVFLLTKGVRFVYEFSLLCMPVLRTALLSQTESLERKLPRPLHALILAVLIIVPFMYFKGAIFNQPKYPFSHKNLPHGVAIFLRHINTGGSVLNHPNNGGYLQWMLYPQYKIFMDMEVPFLFTDEDLYIASNSLRDEEVLRKVISRYNPSFITVHIGNTNFKDIIKKFPGYILVFFDDSEVLYVNRKQYPEIAEKYSLKDIDPFSLIGKNIDSINERERNLLKKSLLKVIEIYPDNGVANQVVSIIYNKQGDYNKAISYAEAIIKNYPESPTGYNLKGNALKGLKIFDKAISSHKIALKRASDLASKNILKEIGLIYIEQEQYKKAYKTLKKAINMFSGDTTYKDLYYLGSSAFLSGKSREAQIAFRFAYQKVPLEDKEWSEKIKRQLLLLGVKPEDI